MFIQRTTNVKDLIERMEHSLAGLYLMDEDEIVTAYIDIRTTEDIKYNIMDDNPDFFRELDYKTDILNNVPPHHIHEYFAYPRDNALESDSFYDIEQDYRKESWDREIKPFLPGVDEDESETE